MLKKIVLIGILLLVFSTNANSEDKNSHSIFKKGLQSLKFGFSGDLSNLKFTEKLIDYKYLLSEKSAIRIGILIDNNTKDYDDEYITVYENDYSYGDTTIVTTNTRESTLNQFTIELLFMHYLSYERKVKGYVGVGPIYSRTKGTNNPYYYDPYYNHTSKSSTFSKSKGISFVLGTEWFMNDYLSLVSEFGFSYSKKTYEYKTNYSSYSTRTEYRTNYYDEKILTTQEARFGLAYYF